MEDKRLFQNKRWTQDPGGVVTGTSEISEEDKKWAEELIKQEEQENINNFNV